jgi:alpha-N-arabinofuranosidase
LRKAAPAPGDSRVAVLLVDTDRVLASIDERIYGHFAGQVRGGGFEGEDFKTYWESFVSRGRVELADVEFKNGKKSVRLHVEGGRAASGRAVSLSTPRTSTTARCGSNAKKVRRN